MMYSYDEMLDINRLLLANAMNTVNCCGGGGRYCM